MSKPTSRLPEPIAQLLDKLRGRIRRYVVVEGLAMVLIWLGLVFWLGLAADYLPVTFGASEMPVGARAVLLAVAALGTVYVLFKWIIRRLWVSLPYGSLALLVERRFPQFGESLITTVEAASSPVPPDRWEQELLDNTRQDALTKLPKANLSELFDPTPLWRKGAGAMLVVVSIGLFAFLAFPAFEIWVSRLAMLSETAWPRMAQIEVVGIEVVPTGTDSSGSTITLPFQDKRVKVARGSSIRLLVHASTKAPTVPRYCTIVYRTADGISNSVQMQRIGVSEDEGQLAFMYDRKPLTTMTASLEFDVIGYDHKLAGYQIEVVERPFITRSEVDAVLPEYTGLLPRREVVSGATRLPVGSQVAITMSSSKPIVSATLLDLTTQEERTLTFDPPAMVIREEYASLDRDMPLEVSLKDIDGVTNEIPYRLKITAVPDTAPEVEMRPVGVGSAITQQARIQLAGRVVDDFGVARAWVEVQVIGGAKLELPVTLDSDGNYVQVIDLQEQQTPDGILRVEPEDKLTIAVFAQDRNDLSQSGNIGTADRLQLDVVTPEKLLSLLEGRELDLRRRFEQIRDETVRLREDYARIQIDGKRFALGPEQFSPTESSPDEEKEASSVEELYRKALDLQRLRIQRAHQASRKADGELQGIGAGFQEIRAELTSNRMDTTARKERLENMIIAPIAELSVPMHAQLQGTTKELEALYDQPEPFMPVVQVALEQTDAIILEMERILEKMFDLENFNELMEKMRQLIDAQAELREETEGLRKKQILELLQ